jgi:hypothetical protein
MCIVKWSLSQDFQHQVSVSPWLLSEYPIVAISNFYKNSRRYSQLCVHWCQKHRQYIIAGVVDTTARMKHLQQN